MMSDEDCYYSFTNSLFFNVASVSCVECRVRVTSESVLSVELEFETKKKGKKEEVIRRMSEK